MLLASPFALFPLEDTWPVVLLFLDFPFLPFPSEGASMEDWVLFPFSFSFPFPFEGTLTALLPFAFPFPFEREEGALVGNG